MKAILQLRNTPDPDCGVSPAEIVFGRRLRDNLLFTDYCNRKSYSKRWQEAWSAKEEALRARFVRSTEELNKHARDLPPLQPGEKCFIQNQTGNHAKKWHHTGTVVDVLPCNKYGVRVDGSGRLTHRNRRFLKAYKPVQMTINGKNGRGHPFLMHQHRSKIAPRRDVVDHDADMRCAVTPSNDQHQSFENPSTIPQEEDVMPDDEIHPEPQPSVTLADRDKQTPPDVTKSKRVPLSLRRLADYNKPGLKETI